MHLHLIAAALCAAMLAACAPQASRPDETSNAVPPGTRPVSECKIPCSVSPGPNCC